MRKQLSVGGGDPKAMSVVVTPATICKLVDVPNLTAKLFGGKIGFITLEGVAEGDAEVQLVDVRGKVIDKVAVKVVKFRSVKVRFYNLVDGKGTEGVSDPSTNPLFTKTALSDLVDAVNNIVLLQCDVSMGLTGAGLLRDLKFVEEFGSTVDIDKVKPFASSDLDPDAEFHVAFVRAIAGPHSNGITKVNFSLMRSSLSGVKRELTLAHEFVHFLSGTGGSGAPPKSHDDKVTDLMFKTAPHGINMRKARLTRIIH
jgi:hypothetical protein